MAYHEITKQMIHAGQIGRWGAGISIVAALLMSGCRYGSHPEDGSSAYVRLINAVPDAGGLDVSVDGKRVWKRSEFRSSTGYQAVSSGTYPVRIEADGLGTTLLSESFSFDKRQNYTLLALGPAGSKGTKVQVLPDEKPEHLIPGKATLRLINAAPGTHALDLVINTIVGIKSVGYGRRSALVILNSGHYDLQLATSDMQEMLVGPVSLDLKSGQSYTLIAMGKTADQSLSLEAYPDRP
ncbi:MAG: DUF4397 domain-containing protein [Janthinobacterium lividum]